MFNNVQAIDFLRESVRSGESPTSAIRKMVVAFMDGKFVGLDAAQAFKAAFGLTISDVSAILSYEMTQGPDDRDVAIDRRLLEAIRRKNETVS